MATVTTAAVQREMLAAMLAKHGQVNENLPRKAMIQACVDNKEVFVSANGALATWLPVVSHHGSPSLGGPKLNCRTSRGELPERAQTQTTWLFSSSEAASKSDPSGANLNNELLLGP